MCITAAVTWLLMCTAWLSRSILLTHIRFLSMANASGPTVLHLAGVPALASAQMLLPSTNCPGALLSPYATGPTAPFLNASLARPNLVLVSLVLLFIVAPEKKTLPALGPLITASALLARTPLLMATPLPTLMSNATLLVPAQFVGGPALDSAQAFGRRLSRRDRFRPAAYATEPMDPLLSACFAMSTAVFVTPATLLARSPPVTVM